MLSEWFFFLCFKYIQNIDKKRLRVVSVCNTRYNDLFFNCLFHSDALTMKLQWWLLIFFFFFFFVICLKFDLPQSWFDLVWTQRLFASPILWLQLTLQEKSRNPIQLEPIVYKITLKSLFFVLILSWFSGTQFEQCLGIKHISYVVYMLCIWRSTSAFC